MSTGKRCSTVLAVLCATVGGLVLLVSPAIAGTVREVGSFSLAEPDLGGLVVEQSSGDVFAVDGGQGAVKKLAAGGTALLTEFDSVQTPAKEVITLAGVAIDESSSPSKGDVYVAVGYEEQAEAGVVDKFAPKNSKPGEYEYVCQLSGPGGGCVREGGKPTTSFGHSLGVTVDSEGDVYVACFVNGAVYEFDSEGNYLGELAGADLVKPVSVAAGLDHTVYVTNFGGATVKMTVNASHEVASETVLDPHQTGGAAVDPTTGNVYVTDAEGGWHVVVYNPAGQVVNEFANKGELGEGSAIAYSDGDERTYVIDKEKENVEVFAEAPEAEVLGVSGVSTGSATLHGTVTPNGSSAEWFFEYGESMSYGSKTVPAVVTGSGEVSAVVEGLGPATVYHYRLVAANAHGAAYSEDATFDTPAGVQDLPASGVTQSSAVLNGTINPGSAPASYRFVYGMTSAYGSVIPTPDLYTPSGDTIDTVSQALGGLQAGTTYHYALVVSDTAGTVTGPDETFTTPSIPPPMVSTGGPTGVSESAVSLTGAVDPQGWDTTYRFEYGTSPAYGSSWPTVPADMGALTGDQSVSIELQNLQPATTYHYRLVASDGGGTSYGADQTFTTSSYPVSIIQATPLGAPLGIAPAKTTKPKAKSKAKTPKHKKAKPRKDKSRKK